MKNKIIAFIDVLVRMLFSIFGVYLLTKYNSDNTIKAAGYSIIIFNIVTTFFDSNYHKNKTL
ncbi:hypothetical protein [Periweissella fabalis]|uniref:Uncharacterized protein n=1 Tax=Periweissella fabalis TaxID=1070421 RepID=A0A7X6N3F3_9LACO|nr:hypothetical protein [Periweissella fabalis]MCM0598449.1 hypothetical protein [Periweissella fabalis]NKZ25066.1 hypothetical protein [Periweissella fabalis]